MLLHHFDCFHYFQLQMQVYPYSLYCLPVKENGTEFSLESISDTLAAKNSDRRHSLSINPISATSKMLHLRVWDLKHKPLISSEFLTYYCCHFLLYFRKHLSPFLEGGGHFSSYTAQSNCPQPQNEFLLLLNRSIQISKSNSNNIQSLHSLCRQKGMRVPGSSLRNVPLALTILLGTRRETHT